MTTDPFDEDKAKRQIEAAAIRREQDLERRRKIDQEAEETGIKITPFGAYKNPKFESKTEVFKVTRTPPYVAVQALTIENKDGSRKATLPLNAKWCELLGDKTEVYVVATANPTGIEVHHGFMSNDKNNPWGV